ncbi:hypothetical protein BDR06DRAFT_958437, partial [Suillus hirtellus]
MSLALSHPDDCALIDDDMVLNDDCNSDHVSSLFRYLKRFLAIEHVCVCCL